MGLEDVGGAVAPFLLAVAAAAFAASRLGGNNTAFPGRRADMTIIGAAAVSVAIGCALMRTALPAGAALLALGVVLQGVALVRLDRSMR